MNWMNTEEHLPKLNEEVLVTDGTYVIISTLRLSENGRTWQIPKYLGKVISWMPLPIS